MHPSKLYVIIDFADNKHSPYGIATKQFWVFWNLNTSDFPVENSIGYALVNRSSDMCRVHFKHFIKLN